MEQTTVTLKTKKFKKSQKEPITTPFQNKLISYLEQTQENDPDKHFLLSLLPDYKKLNDTQKLEFRLNTLQFFKNVQQTQLYLQQNQIYTQYPSAFRLPTQSQQQNHQFYSNSTQQNSTYPNYTHSNVLTQNPYPSSSQSELSHHQTDIILIPNSLSNQQQTNMQPSPESPYN